MGFRVPAPDGRKKDNLPVLVLPEETIINDTYRVSYLTVGGMSIAYKGFKKGRDYFIKEVEATDSKGVISLSQEKATLERLSHAGIVRVTDFFGYEGFYYLVMELIEGESLEKLISPKRDVFLQEKVVLDWAMQLYDIFEYLHGQNPPIIYRDLKPQNIVKDRQGKLHLVDFGIARVLKDQKTSDTMPMGTAITASPEHYGGKQTDGRSDIFTLGATLHFLLTNGRNSGRDLFEFPPVRSINPRVSENLEKVIQKATEFEPEDRYQSIMEMRQAHLNTREIPLPVIEPLGPKSDAKAAALRQQETETLKRAGMNEAAPGELRVPVSLIAVVALCLVFIVGGIVVVNRVVRSPRERSAASPVSFPSTIAALSTASPSMTPSSTAATFFATVTETVEPSPTATSSAGESSTPGSPSIGSSSRPSTSPALRSPGPGLPTFSFPTRDPGSRPSFTPPETNPPKTRPPETFPPARQDFTVKGSRYSYTVPRGFQPTEKKLTNWEPEGLKRIESCCVSYEKDTSFARGFINVMALESDQPITIREAADKFRAFLLGREHSIVDESNRNGPGTKIGCEFTAPISARFDNDIYVGEGEHVVIVLSVFANPRFFEDFRGEFKEFLESIGK